MSVTTIKRTLACTIALATAFPAAAQGADGATARAAQGKCLQGPKVTKYLSRIAEPGLDHTMAKLTWSPEFCPNGKRSWRVFGEPVLTEVGAGGALGIGMNFDAPTRHSIGVTYDGQVRNCVPLGASYSGISYTGRLCTTDARGFVGAYITSRSTSRRAAKKAKIFYRFPDLKEEGINIGDRWVWTNTVI